MSSTQIICGNCIDELKKITEKVDMTFLDPPFNQQKEYSLHNDNMPEEQYWEMMKSVCKMVYDITKKGGCIYFMQREKNTEFILKVLRETGWKFQNLIIWKKKTSAVPVACSGTTLVTTLQLQRKSILRLLDVFYIIRGK